MVTSLRKTLHNGFATEAAIDCKYYAFDRLHYKRNYSIIGDNNISSQKAIIRNGMSVTSQFIKKYYNLEMPHLVYAVSNDNAIDLDFN